MEQDGISNVADKLQGTATNANEVAAERLARSGA